MKSDVKVQHHVDGAAAISNTNYMKMIKECVDGGGGRVLRPKAAAGQGKQLGAGQVLELGKVAAVVEEEKSGAEKPKSPRQTTLVVETKRR